MDKDRSALVVCLLLGIAAICSASTWFGRGPETHLVGWLGASSAILGFGLACWRLGAKASTAPDLAPTLDRLERLIASLEHRPAQAIDAVLPTAAKPDFSDFRQALAEARWTDSARYIDDQPDGPEADKLRAQLSEAKQVAAARLSEELTAARSVGDPVRAVEIRDALALVVGPDDLKPVDTDLVKWLMALIMKRLRTGTAQADVVDLATRVSDRFGHTMEGASLRASLPTLRRSAGLCPRCARPYRGIAEACPICLTMPPVARVPVVPEPESEPEKAS